MPENKFFDDLEIRSEDERNVDNVNKLKKLVEQAQKNTT